MARNKEPKIKLRQPDRSGPDPSKQTLLDLATERGLLQDPPSTTTNDSNNDEVDGVGRLAEALLWSFTLTMGHLTLDVLVANQYAMSIEWREVWTRTWHAFPIILLLFYSFHPHPSPPILLPQLPPQVQPLLHQLLFFVGSVSAGSYLIYITNTYSYYAVMKQAPPVGILWIWSVIELNLLWAVSSVGLCIAFLKYGGYSVT